MRAFEVNQFGVENLTLSEREMPTAGPDEVVIKFHSASLNFRDIMVIAGTYNPRMRLPAIPLSDGAGEVVEIGSNVSRWKVGSRVCPIVIGGWIDGGITAEKAKTAIGAGGNDGVAVEYGVFNTDAIVGIPESLDMAEASSLPCAGVTAWNALMVSGDLKAGETVLLLGTGGVSIFALQIAKTVGAEVIIISGSDEKLERARDLGADHMINYRDNEAWDKAVIEITGGKGVDHVVEVGGVGTLTKSVRAVRHGGHVALIGALDTAGDFNPIPLFMKGIRMQGIFVGSREMLESLAGFYEQNGLHPVIDKKFEFEALADALRYMETGSHFGKIVVEYR